MEEPERIKINYWIFGATIILAFILGMELQQTIDKSNLNSFVKKYSLTDGGYAVEQESYACVYGNFTEMEKFYNNTILPSLQGIPVCFTNNHKFEVKKNGTV